MKKLFVIPLLCGIAVVACTILLEGANLFSYINLSSFLIVTFLPLFAVLIHVSIADIFSNFKLCGKEGKGNMIDLKNAMVFFSELEKLFIVAGVTGFLCGAISLLQLDSDNKIISYGFSVALSSLLYSVGYLVFITIPAKSIIQKKINESESSLR
jgi:hypothetical protein